MANDTKEKNDWFVRKLSEDAESLSEIALDLEKFAIAANAFGNEEKHEELTQKADWLKNIANDIANRFNDMQKKTFQELLDDEIPF